MPILHSIPNCQVSVCWGDYDMDAILDTDHEKDEADEEKEVEEEDKELEEKDMSKKQQEAKKRKRAKTSEGAIVPHWSQLADEEMSEPEADGGHAHAQL